MTGKIEILGAVVDTQQLILYKADGTKIYIPQGDPRIRGIIDQIMPILNAGGVAEISLEPANEYAAFEKKTNGLVRLFRVAKKAIAHLVGSDADREAVEPMAIGQVTTAPKNNGVKADTIDEIMANAVPVSSEDFKESETKEDHTMVAVVGTGKEAKLVPGVEALKGQMSHANKLGSTKGVEALITRLGNVAQNRGHSVQDVLRFLEKGDLPVADDGSIIAYKILTRSSYNKDHKAAEGVYFDCHTQKIPQKVGSYVCVAEELVDRNRRNECSNGLHIARRGYLGSFSGDVCVLTKIAPEDVVTVPHNDPNKVRVCGYHIIGLIPDDEFQKLKRNLPMTDSSECRRLLDSAITGKHVGRLEQVQVTEQKGGGIVITTAMPGIGMGKKPLPKPSEPALEKNIAPQAVALDDKTVPGNTAGPSVSVDPKAVSKQVQDQKSQTQPSRAQLAAELVGRMANGDLPNSERKNAAEALVALKKKSKVSYGALGLTPAQVTTMEQTLKGNIAQKVEQVAVPKLVLKPAPEPAPFPKSTAAPLSRGEQAAYLVKTMNSSIAVHARINAAKQLVELKKKSKVGWAGLNVSTKDANTALDLASDTTPPAPPEPTVQAVAKAILQAPKKVSKPSSKKKVKRTTPKQPVTKVVVVSATSLLAPSAQPKDGPRQVEAKRLYATMTNAANKVSVRKSSASELLRHKKSSKVSWTALGLSQDMSKQIEDLLTSK
jgi:hypothetical protein